MVSVAHGLDRRIPSICPLETIIIQQKAHKLSWRNCWVGIVDMDGNLLMNILERSTLLEIRFDNGLQPCAGHEVFLNQAQFFSFVTRIVWIENGCDILYPSTGFNCWIVQFIFFWDFNIPKTEIVDIVIAKANLRHVIRNGPQGFRMLINRHNSAFFIGTEVNIAKDFDIHNAVILTSFPDIAQTAKPIVWNFHLIAIYDSLLEKTVAIANSISKSWIACCS